MGCQVKEKKTGYWKPCIFPFSRSDVGPNKLFHKCVDVDPNAPDGRLMCSTKTNLTTNMHIDGFGYWGLCDDQHCPGIKGTLMFLIKLTENLAHWVTYLQRN